MKEGMTVRGFALEMESDEESSRGAVLSPDLRYRYVLWRRWTSSPRARRMVVVGLNPSTADATRDDNTLRRCLAFAKREQCQMLVMLNLFAFRATDPKELRFAADPIGPDFDKYFAQQIVHDGVNDDLVVAAWGDPGVHHSRAADVANLLVKRVRVVHCLGKAQAGHPRHPLYVRADAPLIVYRSGGHV
jgi:hypothetical protein